MKHLEYKDTNNKAYKAYYDKFKKMVKQDLNGDGWFLLVKDFPFKDGENLMFTAGEDIGKWQDKNLVSLYGKTKYIIGRCRKKGPVLTLLDFQEGDYVKEATESGLRKELKEYFKGTGVSVRTFKSLKVSDPEPEVEVEDTPEPEVQQEEETTQGAADFKALKMPKLSPGSLKAVLAEAIDYAKKMGVVDEQEFIDLVNTFKKAVPHLGRMKPALAKLNDYLQSKELPQSSTTQTEVAESPAADIPPEGGENDFNFGEINKLATRIEQQEILVAELQEELERQSQEREELLNQAKTLIQEYNTSLEDASENAKKRRFSLAKDSMEILQSTLPQLNQSIVQNELRWEQEIDLLIDLSEKIESLEAAII